jgi:hypothetical protein
MHQSISKAEFDSAEIPLLDLLEELVGCHMRGNRACMLRFVDLIQR